MGARPDRPGGRRRSSPRPRNRRAPGASPALGPGRKPAMPWTTSPIAASRRQVLEGRPGVESVHRVGPAVAGEDLVRERLVGLLQQAEERRPVRRVAQGVEEPPLLFVVGRTAPTGPPRRASSTPPRRSARRSSPATKSSVKKARARSGGRALDARAWDAPDVEVSCRGCRPRPPNLTIASSCARPFERKRPAG